MVGPFLRPTPLACLLLFLTTSHLQAALTFSSPTVDLGEIRAGVVVSHRFPMVNNTQLPIEVTGFRATCGCATPVVEKRLLKPGESGDLLLTIRTLGHAEGPQGWGVDVAWREGKEEQITSLVVRAKVLVEVAVRPASMTMSTSTGGAHEITLTDLRSPALNLTGVRTSSPRLGGRVLGPMRNRKGQVVIRVAVVLSPDCPEGRYEEAVTLQTDDPLYKELTIPVTVVKRPRQSVVASPATVSVSAPAGRPAPSRVVLLRPQKEGQVRIEDVIADDPAITCTWATGPNDFSTLRVTVDRAKVMGETLRSAIHVRLTSPGKETLTIPVDFRLEGISGERP